MLALANIVFSVPGGPTINTPFHGQQIPLKKSGNHIGSTTASLKSFVAASKSAISSKCTLGLRETMSLPSESTVSRSAYKLWKWAEMLMSGSEVPLLTDLSQS